MKSKLILCLIIFSGFSLFSQDKPHNCHDHHRHEIGIANSAIFILKEKELAYGLHFHYVYNIAHSRFGLGIDYERVFDEHKHNNVGIIGSYRPISHLTLSAIPGISFGDSGLSDYHFSLHFEANYDFALKNFHLGPILGTSISHEDIHIGLGLHIGFGF